MHPDLTKGERGIVCRALVNHAKALDAEAKRLVALGYDKMATQLSGEASHVTEYLVKEFEPDAQLDTFVSPGAKTVSAVTTPETTGTTRTDAATPTTHTAGTAPLPALHLMKKDEPDPAPLPTCEACDQPSADAKQRDDLGGLTLCGECTKVLRDEASGAVPLATEAQKPGPWEGSFPPPVRPEEAPVPT